MKRSLFTTLAVLGCLLTGCGGPSKEDMLILIREAEMLQDIAHLPSGPERVEGAANFVRVKMQPMMEVELKEGSLLHSERAKLREEISAWEQSMKASFTLGYSEDHRVKQLERLRRDFEIFGDLVRASM